MKKQIVGFLLSAFLCSTSALSAQHAASSLQPGSAGPLRPVIELAAEGASGGPFLDFIHKLSGPAFFGGGVTVAADYCRLASPNCDARFRLRVSGAYREMIEDTAAVTPDDANLHMITIQPAVEWITPWFFELGAGVAAHQFGGDANSFWHFSFPGYLQVPVLKRSPVRVVVGGGFHLFLPFEADDFAPVIVNVDRDQTEWVKFAFISFEYQGIRKR